LKKNRTLLTLVGLSELWAWSCSPRPRHG